MREDIVTYRRYVRRCEILISKLKQEARFSNARVAYEDEFNEVVEGLIPGRLRTHFFSMCIFLKL